MPKLKIYTPGPRHFFPLEVAQAIGLPRHRSQADVYVAAHTKAEAFQFLTELHLAPSSVHDSDFRVASGRTVDALVAADALPKAGAVAVTRPHGTNSPAVWVFGDGHGCVQFGEFVRGQFVPGPNLVAGGGGLTAAPITEAEAATPARADGSTLAPSAALPVYQEEADQEEAEMLLAQLASSTQRIPEIEAELARARAARDALCRRAVELGLTEQAAREMGVTTGRVYQLRDRALRERARVGEFLPGVKASVEIMNLPPARWPVVEVVEQPADAVVPDDIADRVWVRSRRGEVLDVAKRRLRVAVPSCDLCPPEEAPYGLTPGQLSVHQTAKHGVR